MRRHKESVTLSTDADDEFNHIFPNGHYFDTTTDEIWIGSGIVCAIDIESASLTGHWQVQIHDMRTATFQTIPFIAVAAGGTMTALNPYGALETNTTNDLVPLGNATLLWSANAFKSSATTVATYTEMFHFEPEISCPSGMCILIQPLSGSTAGANLVTVTFESWTKGYTRFANRNSPRNVFA